MMLRQNSFTNFKFKGTLTSKGDITASINALFILVNQHPEEIRILRDALIFLFLTRPDMITIKHICHNLRFQNPTDDVYGLVFLFSVIDEPLVALIMQDIYSFYFGNILESNQDIKSYLSSNYGRQMMDICTQVYSNLPDTVIGNQRMWMLQSCIKRHQL